MRAAGLDAEQVLRTVAPGYLLDISERECDVGRFEQERALGVAAGSAATSAEHFRAALAEWHGEVLADLRDLSFANEYAAALEELRWATVSGRIEADIACGKASLVLGELQSMVIDQPLREPLWGQLITALYLSGRQVDALEACRRVRAVLAEELGIDPSRQLVELEQRILRQEPVGGAEQEHVMAATIADTSALPRGCRLRLADGSSVEMRAGVLRIGRMPGNELTLDDPKVSRWHAAITRTGGAVVLRDLDSTNGVYADGSRILADTAVADGTEIRIGSCTMVVEITPGDSRSASG